LETDTTGADAIGAVIPQTPASATFAGSYGVYLSDQSNREIERGFSVGDRIQFTRPTNRSALPIATSQ
jgi:hypothetical protein